MSLGTIQQCLGRAEQVFALQGGVTVIEGEAARRAYYYCKRVLDTSLSLLLLALLSPLMLIIAVMIKLDSRGPVLFAAERVGCRPQFRDGRGFYFLRHFCCYKFRSMTAGADHTLHQASVRDFVNGSAKLSGNGTFKCARDPRVTRIGRLLRKASLDELPQLLNVLKGEMSLVGPRPVPPYEAAHYQEPQFGRLAALPGITGLWQVSGRCKLSFNQMIALDLEYVRRASLWLDLKIMFRTIPAVISARGAE